MLIIIIRSVLLYLLVIFALRLMGKKQLGELQPSELVTTILVSNIATLSLEDPSMPMIMGIMPILMIVCLDVFMSGIMLKNTKIRTLVTGSPKIIIKDGEIDQLQLKSLRYTIDDVTEAMREHDIFDISQVQYAIVETTGKINFLEKQADGKNPPTVIIKDGEIDGNGLKEIGIGRAWVDKVIAENKTELSRIFFMSCDSDGKYTLVLKNYDIKEGKAK
ncbi:MAG: DUF421 domain-containing protein [Ruminiclostridium sp.]